MEDALKVIPDSKVHGANMGAIWSRQDPGGPHVGPMWTLLSGMPYIKIYSCFIYIEWYLFFASVDVDDIIYMG